MCACVCLLWINNGKIIKYRFRMSVPVALEALIFGEFDRELGFSSSVTCFLLFVVASLTSASASEVLFFIIYRLCCFVELMMMAIIMLSGEWIHKISTIKWRKERERERIAKRERKSFLFVLRTLVAASRAKSVLIRASKEIFSFSSLFF